MRVHQSEIYLSATDLANHLSCGHLTALDLRLAKGELTPPKWENPHLRVLATRGLEHERAYIESLRTMGLRVTDLSHLQEEPARAATLDAMRRGEQAIVQGSLVSGTWRGRTDVLLRVPRPSVMDEWSYEVVDCKLSRETKAETILQLCLYSDLLAGVQGKPPERFHVIRPNAGFEPESYRFSAFAAYYRKVKSELEAYIEKGSGGTYPEPVNHCEICRWWKECDRQRRSDDHLCFVAGASRLQRNELAAQGVATLEALAKLALPIPFAPGRGARESYVRIREQARLQFESRTEGRLKFEMLTAQAGEGLSRLPTPSAGDIFLDFEGDPFVGEGGLEYLFGIVTDGAYQGRWALNRAQERAAFEWFIDFTFERLTRLPDLHIYHFGAYEPGAIKRLMLRYVTREEEVDRLLRGKVFVDLHNITKQTLRASVEQYSLKELERFCNYLRVVPLAEANQARHVFDHQLELDASPEPSSIVEPITRMTAGRRPSFATGSKVYDLRECVGQRRRTRRQANRCRLIKHASRHCSRH